MNDRRRHKRRRADRAHSRVRSPRCRRLAVEQTESRLMLSGDGVANLDTDTFNLDSFADYAIISSDSAPAIVPIADPLVNQSVDDRISDNGNDSSFGFRDAWAGFNGSLVASYDSLDLVPARDNALNSLGTGQYRFTVLDPSWSSDPEFLNVAPGSGLSKSPLFEILGNGHGVSVQILGDRVPSTSPMANNSGGAVSIDVVAPKLSIEPAIKPTDTKHDPATITTSPAPVIDIVDVQVEPVVTTVEEIRSSEAPTLIVPVAPSNEYVAIADSDAQINVGRVIYDLLTSDTSVIDQPMQYNADGVSRDELQPTGAAVTLQVVAGVDALEDNDTKLVASASTDEGGMIPIQEIVGRVSQESVAAPEAEQVATVDAPGDISGELARVAVMELLEGEADPAAPRETADFTFLVAVDEAAFVPERIAINRAADQESATLAAVQAVVDQAALAMSIVAPANPIYFAAMLSTASDAFSTAAVSGPLTPPAISTVGIENVVNEVGARSEAFSQWDDNTEPSAVSAFERSDYGLLPIVGVLAAERVVAASRKRNQGRTSQAAPQAGRPQPMGPA